MVVILVFFSILKVLLKEQLVWKLFEDHCIKCLGKGEKIKWETNLFQMQAFRKPTKKIDLMQSLIEELANGDITPEDQPELKFDNRKDGVNELRGMLKIVQKRVEFFQAYSPY